MVETNLLEQETPVLPKEAAKHLKVLRPEAGEPIELFDGKGKWRTYEFSGDRTSSSPLTATAQVLQAPRASQTLTLFACVTKGSRWDWTVEKATELGVTRIVPVISDRTIVRIPKTERAAKRERWQRIAEDAARQSDAKWVTEILEPVDFCDCLDLVRQTTCLIGALTDPPSPPIARALAELNEDRDLATFIGPEGDFTPDELAALMSVARPVSFGNAILRAETAAIFAVSVIKSFLPAQALTVKPACKDGDMI